MAPQGKLSKRKFITLLKLQNKVKFSNIKLAVEVQKTDESFHKD